MTIHKTVTLWRLKKSLRGFQWPLDLRQQNLIRCQYLRKVFGSQQIDALLQQARDIQQFKQRQRRLRNNSLIKLVTFLGVVLCLLNS